MKKKAEDEGVSNVNTVDLDSENIPENGHSDADDWKKPFEREKFEREILKLKTDQEKAELEIKDLKRPPFFRAAFITVLGPAVLSLFAAAMAIYFSTYSPQVAKLSNANAELANRESQITDKNAVIAGIEQQKETAQKQLDELTKQISEYQAKSEAEKNVKERLVKTNESLQARQDALQNQLVALDTIKEENEKVIKNLEVKYADLTRDIVTATYDAKIAKLEIPISDFLRAPTAVDPTMKDGISAGTTSIINVYDAYPQYQEEYEKYFKELFGKDYTLRQKLRIATLLYKLSHDLKWKNKYDSLIKVAIHNAVKDIQSQKTNPEFRLGDIIADIVVIDEKLATPTLDLLNDEIKDLPIEAVYSVAINIALDHYFSFYYGRNKWAVIRHPIFFQFAHVAAVLTNQEDEAAQERGLRLIDYIAGKVTQGVFMSISLANNKIRAALVDSILQRREYGPVRNLSELQNFFSFPENKCLIDYWSGKKLGLLVADSALLESVIKGECR